MQTQTRKTCGDPNPVDTKGPCLLSLDGGGVRGLSTLFILKSIMDRLNRERCDAKLPPVKPCEIFDLIDGTSTGGLLAIMLGRLEMGVDECISAYIELMKTIFEDKLKLLPVGWTGKIKPRFNSGKLKDAIMDVAARQGASGTELFNDGSERGTKVFVCATAKETSGVTRLRSYSLSEEPDIPATICEAALATSAATGFFDPVSIGSRCFVDGALGPNNPVDEVEGEASNIWCPDTGNLKPLVKCFISIGTGNLGKRAIEDNISKFLSKTLVAISTETKETERKFIARWAGHFDEKRFFRFNVEQGLQNVGLAEYQEQGLIEAATYEFPRSRIRQGRPPSHHAYRNIPFPRNEGFVGRGEQLDKLEELLFSPGHRYKVAITGLGGVGKTQVALELAYRTQRTRPECSIYWIAAGNFETLQRTYFEIVQQLQLPGLEDEQADAKNLLKDHLCDSSAGQWLLVFDNADDISMWFGKPGGNTEPCGLSEYIPRSETGSVLFTTCFKKIATKLAKQDVIAVPEMDEAKATELLGKRLVDYHVCRLKTLWEAAFL
ncbi:hypothetical protein CNMCM6106_001575 [Aspergillus hiratsukae]|uniref:PNPLA domain-containing protein n=1 Tax=Aspergillus hiratsukae TaxID=1194566 RepID=A0A8H6UTI8_9EURO|nr:hypothetical protein CNMCM6106_001575 [Aspergillus hiratsukae]